MDDHFGWRRRGVEKDVDRVIHETLFGEAVVNASVAALLADDEGRYIAANDAAVTLTGYERERLVGFRMGELSADEGSAALYHHLARDEEMQGRKTVRRSNGELVACRYYAIRTLVSRLPYFLLLLWPQDAVSARSSTTA